MLEVLQSLGAFVAFVTGVFVLYDRFVRDHPIIDVRPCGEDHSLELIIRNVARQGLQIKSIECSTPTMGVSFSESVRDTIEALVGRSFSVFIPPENEKVFQLISRDGWKKLSPTDSIRIVARWSFTRSTWLPMPPLRYSATAGDLTNLKKARLR